MDAGRIARESLDFGEIRENLKQAWYAVMAEPLTVADVERLDRLISQCEGHRKRQIARYSTPSTSRQWRPRRPHRGP